MWLLGCCYVIAGLLLCDCWAVAMLLLGCPYVIAGVFWVVARLLLCDCWAVAMELLGCSEWLLDCCYVIARLLLCDCWAVAMGLLGCSEWLIDCSYVIAGVFRVVARLLLCDCWAVTMWFLECSGWLLGWFEWLINVISFCFSLLDIGGFWCCRGRGASVVSGLSSLRSKGSQRLVRHHRLLPIRPLLQTEPQRNPGIHRKHRTWWRREDWQERWQKTVAAALSQETDGEPHRRRESETK